MTDKRRTRRQKEKESQMAEVGATYGDTDTSGIFNIGHGIVSVTNGQIIGKLTYPGPGSGNVSSQEGDCSAIVAQMPWIVGAGAPGGGQAGAPQPHAVQDGDLHVTTAGYTKRWAPPGTTDMQVTAEWTFVGTDGVAVGGDLKTSAQKALKDALVTASAAAAVLARQ
jgi:hypothetical protein